MLETSALTVLIPAYNEERTIATVVEHLITFCPSAQLVLIDDGSTDQTVNILKKKARPQDSVISIKHAGKGAAIVRGLEHAQGLFTIIQDADLEYDPRQIPKLLTYALKKRRTAIFGSRFLTKNPCIYPSYCFGNKMLTLFINLLFNTHLSDTYTCYKLLPTDLFRSLNLQSKGFELEAEICCKCLMRRIPIIERPIKYMPRTIEDGKKIRWEDAVKGMLTAVMLRCGLPLYDSHGSNSG